MIEALLGAQGPQTSLPTLDTYLSREITPEDMAAAAAAYETATAPIKEAHREAQAAARQHEETLYQEAYAGLRDYARSVRTRAALQERATEVLTIVSFVDGPMDAARAAVAEAYAIFDQRQEAQQRANNLMANIGLTLTYRT